MKNDLDEIKKEEEPKNDQSPKKKKKKKKKIIYPNINTIPEHKPFLNDDLGAGTKKETEKENLSKNFEIR